MEQSKELRYDVLDRVCHKHLVAVQLDLVARYLYVVLDLREIQDTCQVERIVHIEVDMEQRLVSHRIESLVELVVILILKISRLLCPKRLYLIDYVILISILILTVLPLLFLAEDHRHRHELAIFVQKAGNARLLRKLLLILCDVKGDDSSSVSLVTLLHVILRRAVA